MAGDHSRVSTDAHGLFDYRRTFKRVRFEAAGTRGVPIANVTVVHHGDLADSEPGIWGIATPSEAMIGWTRRAVNVLYSHPLAVVSATATTPHDFYTVTELAAAVSIVGVLEHGNDPVVTLRAPLAIASRRPPVRFAWLEAAAQFAADGNTKIAFRRAIAELDLLVTSAEWAAIGSILELSSTNNHPWTFRVGVLRLLSKFSAQIPGWNDALKDVTKRIKAAGRNPHVVLRGLSRV